MNMSLNLPRRKGPGSRLPSSVVIQAVNAHLLQVFAETGVVPTNMEISQALGFNYVSICRAWRHLTSGGLLPEAIPQARQDQLLTKPKRGSSQHLQTGPCTAEMAGKIFQLLKNDLEARATFFELLRGNFRKADHT